MPITVQGSARPGSGITLRFLAEATDVGYGERIDGEKQDAGVLVMPHDMHTQVPQFPIAYSSGTDVTPA